LPAKKSNSYPRAVRSKCNCSDHILGLDITTTFELTESH
jgi:hypothetical protein